MYLIRNFKHFVVDRNVSAVKNKFVVQFKVEFDVLLKAGLPNCPFMTFSMTPATTEAVFTKP